MLETGLISARFLHFTALLVLFGASFYPLYVYPNSACAPPMQLVRWLHWVLFIATILGLLSGILWFMFTAANMAGAVTGLVDEDALWSVLHDTGFGRVWAVRIALLSMMLGLTGVSLSSSLHRGLDKLQTLVAAALLASLAGVGHAQQGEGVEGILHLASDTAHLLAAGAWLGGLLPLSFVLARISSTGPANEIAGAYKVLLRFSGMGYLAVAVLVGSGIANSWFLVESAANLIWTPYGQLLLTKVLLFAGMAILAAANRLWIVPALARKSELGRSIAWLARLRKHVFGEQALGLAVMFIVSALGTMEPALSHSNGQPSN